MPTTTHTSDGKGSSSSIGSHGGFSLMNSLKGGASVTSGTSGDADSTRLREGLTSPKTTPIMATTPEKQSSHLRSPPQQTSPTMASNLAPHPMTRTTNSFTSSSSYHQQQQKRRTANYRNGPKKHSPKQKGSSDNNPNSPHRAGGGGGRWNFPGLSPSYSVDSDDHSSSRASSSAFTAATTQVTGNTKNSVGAAAGHSLKSTSFDDCYAKSPGYHDAFTLLEENDQSNNIASPAATAGTTPSPRGGHNMRSFFPGTSPKKEQKELPVSPKRNIVKVAPSSPSRLGPKQAPQAEPPSPKSTKSSLSGSGRILKKKPPNPLSTNATGGTKQNIAISLQPTPVNDSKSPPNSPPHAASMPAPPSGKKDKAKVSAMRSASPVNFPLATKTNNIQSASRTASPMRHASPLSASRMKKTFAKTWSKAKTRGVVVPGVSSHHARSRSRGSGKYSDAVSKVLEEDNIGRDVDIIDKPAKSGGTGTIKSQEGIEVISSLPPSPSKRSTIGGKSKLRTRSPSPVRHLGSIAGNNTSVKSIDNDAETDPSLHMDKDSMASTPSFFGRGRINMSPGRMKRTLKKRLAIPQSPKPQRPPQHQTSPEKHSLPLYPASESGKGSVEDGDGSIDELVTSLAHTTMSFDVEDNPRSFIGASTSRDALEPAPSIPENDVEDDEGYYINTTLFNIFESKEFLRAMDGNVSEASLATNYIRTGDGFCGKDGEDQFERAVQVYYAGLGVILTRINESSLQHPVESAPDETHVMYSDFLTVAQSPETNILLLAMSSILLRAGNAHFQLKQYECACRDYVSAQSYRTLRHEARDIIFKEKKNYSNIHVEDSKLYGRISNNMASAQSKQGMYDEARSEYTKALQIKQSTLEALHKAKSTGGAKKDVNDKKLVSDIASTFHNIGLLRIQCGEPKKAEKAYKQSLSLRVKKFGLDDLGVSSTLRALGDLYYQQNQYDDAFRSYKESLRIWKSHCGKRDGDLKMAQHYYNIGLVFYSKGPYGKAMASVTECLRIRRVQAAGDDNLEVASACHLLGLISSASGNYEEALSLFEESLDIRQTLLESDDHLLLLNVQLAMGTVYQKKNDLDSAMDCFSIVLNGRTRRLGNDHISVSEVLQAIGVAYAAANEYHKAYNTLEEALRIRKTSPGSRLEVADTLNSMSLIHFKSGDTEKAIELSEEALKTTKSSVGTDHLLVGKVLKNMGDYCQDAEAYDDAMEAYSESLRVMTIWYGREHLFLSEVLNEIGVTRFKNGEFMVAKKSFTEALRLMRLTHSEANKSAIFPTLNHLGHALYKNSELKLAAETYIESFDIQVSIVTGDVNNGLKEFGAKLNTIKERITMMEQEDEDVAQMSESLGGIASILRYLGLVIQEQGDFEAALSANKLSLSVRLCQPHKEHAAIALMAETIAMFEYKRNNLASAMDYFNQALRAKKSFQGESTIDVARTVNNLANIHFSLGELDAAMKLYQEALEIKRHCLGDDSDEVANTLNNIAHVMVNAGKEQEALKAYHNVVKIRQDRYGKSHVSVASTLASMGDVYIKIGKLEIAMTYFEQCIRIQKLRQENECDVRILENLGSIYGKLGEWHKAESTFKEIIGMKRAAQGNISLDVAKTLDLLAVSYIEQDRYAESVEHLQEALRIRKGCLDEDDEEILASLNKLAFVYKSLEMTAQMMEVREEFEIIQARRRVSC